MRAEKVVAKCPKTLARVRRSVKVYSVWAGWRVYGDRTGGMMSGLCCWVDHGRVSSFRTSPHGQVGGCRTLLQCVLHLYTIRRAQRATCGLTQPSFACHERPTGTACTAPSKRYACMPYRIPRCLGVVADMQTGYAWADVPPHSLDTSPSSAMHGTTWRWTVTAV